MKSTIKKAREKFKLLVNFFVHFDQQCDCYSFFTSLNKRNTAVGKAMDEKENTIFNFY